jgi:leucyl aminopeptidase
MLKLRSLKFTKTIVPTLAIPVCSDEPLFSDEGLSPIVETALQYPEFSGKQKQTLTLYTPAGIKAERVVLIGLGPRKEVQGESLRTCAGELIKMAAKGGLTEIAIAAPPPGSLDMDTETIVRALGEGAVMANYAFEHYKSESEHTALKRIDIAVTRHVTMKYKHLASEVQIVCEGNLLARHWANLAPNEKSPESLAKMMAQEARRRKLKVRVMSEKELARLKFGALLAVGMGSHKPPRLVLMEYRNPGASKTVALVGKGVTFDTGGINLKPSDSITGMKMDMAGSAAMAATLVTVARLKPKINVIGALPLAENMPSGKAVRPSDIITAYSGKTVEINNTDAEGRLILADAMAYVNQKYKPDLIIDMATLTGACVMALGEKIAGVFTPDKELENQLLSAGERSYERCWPLPLPEDYKEELKSDYADISNIGKGRWGGAITAALFLKEFVGDTPWAHIDIAGPASTKKGASYQTPGATGFGVRLMWEFIRKFQTGD